MMTAGDGAGSHATVAPTVETFGGGPAGRGGDPYDDRFGDDDAYRPRDGDLTDEFTDSSPSSSIVSDGSGGRGGGGRGGGGLRGVRGPSGPFMEAREALARHQTLKARLAALVSGETSSSGEDGR